MGNTIAVFDLDGTITDKDTYLEFIKYSKGKAYYYLGFLLLSPYVVLFYLKLISNHKLKEVFFSFFFRDENYSKIKNQGDKFSELILPILCRNSALKVLEWHTDQNHDILILSASADIWLEKWCKIRGFQLICTEFEVKNDKFTGKLEGNNCHGVDKKSRLTSFLSQHNYAYSFGYGDSKADQYFLQLVNEDYLMALSNENVFKYWKNN